MSPRQPQGYLARQHSDVTDHRSIFLNEEQSSAMFTQTKGVLFGLVLMSCPSVQSYWGNMCLGSVCV